MVGHAADAENRTIEAVADPSEIMLHLIGKLGVLQEGPAILRRKNQVQVNLRERLRHHGAPLMLPLQGRSRMVTTSQGALRDPGLCEKTPLGFGGPDPSFGNAHPHRNSWKWQFHKCRTWQQSSRSE